MPGFSRQLFLVVFCAACPEHRREVPIQSERLSGCRKILRKISNSLEVYFCQSVCPILVHILQFSIVFAAAPLQPIIWLANGYLRNSLWTQRCCISAMALIAQVVLLI